MLLSIYLADNPLGFGIEKSEFGSENSEDCDNEAQVLRFKVLRQ